jgi:hypothetical protein
VAWSGKPESRLKKARELSGKEGTYLLVIYSLTRTREAIPRMKLVRVKDQEKAPLFCEEIQNFIRLLDDEFYKMKPQAKWFQRKFAIASDSGKLFFAEAESLAEVSGGQQEEGRWRLEEVGGWRWSWGAAKTGTKTLTGSDKELIKKLDWYFFSKLQARQTTDCTLFEGDKESFQRPGKISKQRRYRCLNCEQLHCPVETYEGGCLFVLTRIYGI